MRKNFTFRKRIEEITNNLKVEKDSDAPMVKAEDLERELRAALTLEQAVHEIQNKKWEVRYSLWKEQKVEATKAVVTFGQSAIRGLLAINGAAIIAILTFIGRLEEVNKEVVELFAQALLCFALGVGAAAAIAMLAYATQYLYNESVGRASRVGIFAHVASIFFSLLSLGAFLWGVFVSYEGLLALI